MTLRATGNTDQQGMPVTVTMTSCLQEVAGVSFVCFLQEKEKGDVLGFLFLCTRTKHIALACNRPGRPETSLLDCYGLGVS